MGYTRYYIEVMLAARLSSHNSEQDEHDRARFEEAQQEAREWEQHMINKYDDILSPT